ncbi:hypothetical protein C7S15_8434 [Burkholderia cepacia]|nr:hypothetical protein [Burkholderia cepacia]
MNIVISCLSSIGLQQVPVGVEIPRNLSSQSRPLRDMHVD